MKSIRRYTGLGAQDRARYVHTSPLGRWNQQGTVQTDMYIHIILYTV